MKRKFYILFGLSILFFACQKEEADINTDSAQRIYLRATVENTILMSRAPFSLSEPDENNPLKVAVWASTTKDQFQGLGKTGTVADNGDVALHTTANFSNGKEQLLNEAVYPKNETPVYFVGLHPVQQDGESERWQVDDTGTKAKTTFNGSEDIMFAPQIKGVYSANKDEVTWPTFQFHHLLTWLIVRVKAENEDVSAAWGKLKGLQLRSSVGNTVTIDLRVGDNYDFEKQTFDPKCVSFSGDNTEPLNFYKTGTNEEFQGQSYVLPYNDEYKEVAYVLCAPVDATSLNEDRDSTNEYTLIVQTDSRIIEVPVDLKKTDTSDSFEGSTMNRKFTLNLNFKMGNNITITASVTDWQVGGISNGVFNPSESSDPLPDDNTDGGIGDNTDENPDNNTDDN